MNKKNLKLTVITFSILVFTATIVVAFDIDSTLKEISISEEESEANLKSGIQATLESENEKENEKKFLEQEYLKYGKVSPTEVKDPKEVKNNKKKLPKEKADELSFWEEKGKRDIGQYKRKISQISGELPSDAKRVTLSEVKQIISKKSDFKSTVDQIERLNKYPDFEGGSGVTIKEFWLDENGKEKIIVIDEQKQIFHAKMRDEHNIESFELLNADGER